MSDEIQRYDGEDEWLTIPQAIAYTKISRTMLYKYMANNTLKWYHLKDSDHRRVRKSDLDKLMLPGNIDESTSEEENSE